MKTRKEAAVNIGFEVAERDSLVEAAERKGLSLAEYLRRAIRIGRPTLDKLNLPGTKPVTNKAA